MKQTIVKKITHAIVGSSLLLGATAYADVMCTDGADPIPVSGKITNNGQPSSGEAGTVSTLGVVAMKMGQKPGPVSRMKCGIIGVNIDPITDPNPYDQFIPVGFIHTLSCDDSVEIYGMAAHSQLSLDTEGEITFAGFCNGTDPSAGIFGSFVESSIPVANTGRGIFTGVSEGEITIEGDINCLGSIDMVFAGEICPAPAP